MTGPLLTNAPKSTAAAFASKLATTYLGAFVYEDMVCRWGAVKEACIFISK
jgi:hypothetical protein